MIVTELSRKFNILFTNVGKGASLFENVQPRRGCGRDFLDLGVFLNSSLS
jgi:hypothetical protein